MGKFALAAVAALTLLATAPATRAEDLKVMETHPAAKAMIGGPSEDFFVRFDKPVDHIRSLLIIRRDDGTTVATLQPRFKTEPNVLFARRPPLPAGAYIFHWSVRNLQGTEVTEGEVPFSVTAAKAN